MPLLQKRDYARKIDASLAQRRKDSVSHCLVKIHSPQPCFRLFVVEHILQMHSPDARDLLFKECNRVAPAVYIVTCIEAKAQFILGEQRKEAIDLLGSFHMAADVVM